jgi:hypothetical protein
LFLLQKLLAVKRACRVKFEPRTYAVQVEAMVVVAWKFNYEGILVYGAPRVSYSLLGM